jgi:diphthine-ammonia ligase
MKYVALLSGGKDSCYNLLHCSHNGHELVAAASLGPENGKGPTALQVDSLSLT